MSAEDAIARAKAIAARLAGTGATASFSASSSSSTTPGGGASAAAPSDPRSAASVNAVAEAALNAALGGGGGDTGTIPGKRKRWGTDSSSSGTYLSKERTRILSRLSFIEGPLVQRLETPKCSHPRFDSFHR